MTKNTYSGQLSGDEKNDLQLRKNDIIRKCINLLTKYPTTSEEQDIIFNILKKITLHRVSAYRDRVQELCTYEMTILGIVSAHTNQSGHYGQQAILQQSPPVQQHQNTQWVL